MTKFKFAGIALAVSSALALSACDTSIDVDPDHDHGHDHGHDHDHAHGNVSNDGFLVLSDADNLDAFLYDLRHADSDGPLAVGQTERLAASPGGGYALALQEDRVRILSVAGHSHDHSHDHDVHFELLDFELTGENLVDYQRNQGRGAVFFAGEAGVPATIYAISDHSISEDRTLGSVQLDFAVNGRAQAWGNDLFVTNSSADDGVADYIRRYHREDGSYEYRESFTNAICPDIQSTVAVHDYLAFGCSDGLLLVGEEHHDHDHSHDHGDFEVNKVDIANGVDALFGHPEASFVVAYSNSNLYQIRIDHGDAEISPIEWRSDDHADAQVLDVAFNGSGNRMAVLDDHGYITVVRFRDEGHADFPFAIQSHVHVLEHASTSARLATSELDHGAYVTDQDHNRVVVVDLHDGLVLEERDLDFTPGFILWLPDAEDDHHH